MYREIFPVRSMIKAIKFMTKNVPIVRAIFFFFNGEKVKVKPPSAKPFFEYFEKMLIPNIFREIKTSEGNR